MLEFQKSPNDGNSAKAEAIQKRILQIRERIKATAAAQKEECLAIKARLEHLANFKTNHHSWQNDRFYRQLSEYLFQCGFHQTALKLTDAMTISDVVNSGLFLKFPNSKKASKIATRKNAWPGAPRTNRAYAK